MYDYSPRKITMKDVKNLDRQMLRKFKNKDDVFNYIFKMTTKTYGDLDEYKFKIIMDTIANAAEIGLRKRK